MTTFHGFELSARSGLLGRGSNEALDSPSNLDSWMEVEVTIGLLLFTAGCCAGQPGSGYPTATTHPYHVKRTANIKLCTLGVVMLYASLVE